MDVAGLRQQIPTCQGLVYMNTGWSGPSPVLVVQAIKQRLDYEMESGPTSPEVLESGRLVQGKLREAVARLLNASPQEICLTQNTTEGLNIVVNGLPWREGDEIITCSLEHSSVLTPSYYQRRRHGVVVKVLPVASDEAPDNILGKFEEAITARTRMVFLSHIQYSSGLRMPLAEIRRMTRDRNILILLDGAQAAGHIPLDMKEMGCDFYSIPGQKWLLGAEGTGALYIREELISRLEPTMVAGKAAVRQDDPYLFEANTSSIDKFRLTSSSAPLQAGMLEAIGFIQNIGVGHIEARNLALAASLKQALQEIPGVKILSPLDRSNSSGLVSFSIDGVEPGDAASNLWQEHRIVARSVGYPPCLRVSLHFFNTEEEVDLAVDAVRGLSKSSGSRGVQTT